MVDTSITHVVYHRLMCIISFEYLFWLTNNKKGKYPEFCMGYSDETWYVGSGVHKYYPHGLSSNLIPDLHVYSDLLITKKANIQSSVWATVTKLGMSVVVDRSTTKVVCHHQMRIFNTSFAYLFWLANTNKGKYSEFCMGYSDET